MAAINLLPRPANSGERAGERGGGRATTLADHRRQEIKQRRDAATPSPLPLSRARERETLRHATCTLTFVSLAACTKYCAPPNLRNTQLHEISKSASV